MNYIIITNPATYIKRIGLSIQILSNWIQLLAQYAKNHYKNITISIIKYIVHQPLLTKVFSTVDHLSGYFKRYHVFKTKYKRGGGMMGISYGFFENYLIKEDILKHPHVHNGVIWQNPYIPGKLTHYNQFLISGVTLAGSKLQKVILYKNTTKIEILKPNIHVHKRLFNMDHTNRIPKLNIFAENLYSITIFMNVKNELDIFNTDQVELYINSNYPAVKLCIDTGVSGAPRPITKKINQKNANKKLIIKEFGESLNAL